MKIIKTGLIIICLFLAQGFAYAQNPADYLILQGIGGFNNNDNGKCGTGSGIIGAVNHFEEDHPVLNCKTDYYSTQQKMTVEVAVEKHTGGNSDKWLFHEIEDIYREFEAKNLGMMAEGAVMRKINNQNVLWIGISGGSFIWVSKNFVIEISYTDLPGANPEPLEVVEAYLAIFPSTIRFTDADLKSQAHTINWIKNEMDRRLWLCDKWNKEFRKGQTTNRIYIYNINRGMEIFLGYREKYYGISAKDELESLYNYRQANDIPSLLKKLREYKTWWKANKKKSISLQ